jgi:site-specific DNA-cytosine methylase
MKTLELFAGSCSFSKVAKEKGHKIFTTDIKQFGDIDYVVDILEFDYNRVPYVPDIIWASPPCTTFSVASLGHHWTGGKGAYKCKTKECEIGKKLLSKTLEIIRHYKKLNDKLIFYIENPRGVMRKMDEMQLLQRHTITYCQYGDERMKPTDIWTNDRFWKPRPMCKNGDTCHVSAPRGSRTGTQGLKNNFERSKIPKDLFLEIIK